MPAASVQDLGSLQSVWGGVVSGKINNSDQVAVVVGGRASYRWQSGSFSLADIYPSWMSYNLTEIDGAGVLTGYFSYFHNIPLRWFGGTEYQTLAPGYTQGESEAFGVNAAGDAVGFSNGLRYDPPTNTYVGPFDDIAQLWHAGSRDPVDLGLGEGSRATAINDNGQITGHYRGPTGASNVRVAFLYQGGTATPLPNLPGYNTSRGIGISDRGWVIGAVGPDGNEVGVLWKPDAETGAYTAHALGFVPVDINENHVIVGGSGKVSFEGGPAADVNRLLPPGTAWTLQTITGINDNNNLVGRGTYTGGAQGNSGLYLLTGLEAPPPADISMRDATTEDLVGFKTINIQYSVSGGDMPGEFAFRAYLSSDATLDRGEDVRLGGELRVPEELGRSGPEGKEQRYRAQLILEQAVRVTQDRRFIIVVADDDRTVADPNESDNAMFVIPLPGHNTQGGFAKTGVFVQGLSENLASPRIAGRMSRGTADYTRLEDITDVWTGIGGTFKDEEPAPFRGDDHLVEPFLVEPLTRFVGLIEEAQQQERLNGSPIRITDAFDEQGEHASTSRHYEGRAIDFGATGDALRRLAGLALLAGFDWINVETQRNHLHVSHSGLPADVSTSSLSEAVAFGRDSLLIVSQVLAARLQTKLARVDRLTQEITGGTLTAPQLKRARSAWATAIDRFISAVQQGIADHQIQNGKLLSSTVGEKRQWARFGGLLIFNAKRLKTIPPQP